MDDDVELADEYCPKCGKEAYWQRCPSCGGEGYNDDLYELDPLWYNPGDYEVCQECQGWGHFCWCRNCGWDLREHRFLNESNKPVKEFAQKRPFTFIGLRTGARRN